MRVIAGRLRGRTIATPRGAAVRPTYDRVRESLFGSLGERVEGSSVLDLFAGTGSLGIESLSRGADSVTFVEKDGRALATVRRNISELGLEPMSTVIRSDALRALSASLPGAPFDIVFIDPPYTSGLAEPSLESLGSGALLSSDALVVVERADSTELRESYGDLMLTRSKRYGSTVVDFFERHAPKGPAKEET